MQVINTDNTNKRNNIYYKGLTEKKKSSLSSFNNIYNLTNNFPKVI
jgi:hypothetical protein